MATRRRLLEAEVGRLGRELVLGRARVLGEGALADAEHLVAGLEPGHVLADRLHDAGDVHARDGVLRCPQPVAREADRVRQAGHDVPDAPVDAGGAHADQDLVVADRGPVDVAELAGHRRPSRSASWTIAFMSCVDSHDRVSPIPGRCASPSASRPPRTCCARPTRMVSGPSKGWRSTTSSCAPRRDAAVGEVAQHLRVGVGDPRRTRPRRRPRASSRLGARPFVDDELRVGDRVAVRVVRRVSELVGDPRSRGPRTARARAPPPRRGRGPTARRGARRGTSRAAGGGAGPRAPAAPRPASGARRGRARARPARGRRACCSIAEAEPGVTPSRSASALVPATPSWLRRCRA